MICVRYIEKAKKIAKKKGIAFTHISTELGKSRGYLSEMLANGRDLPEHMLADVASLLGVTVADLTGEKENPASVYTGGEVDTAKMLTYLDNLSTKKPTAQGDGLSEKQQDAIKLVQSMSDDDLVRMIETLKIWTAKK